MSIGFFMYGKRSLAVAELVAEGRVRILAELGEVNEQKLDEYIAGLTKAKEDLKSGRFPLKQEL